MVVNEEIGDPRPLYQCVAPEVAIPFASRDPVTGKLERMYTKIIDCYDQNKNQGCKLYTPTTKP
jgi:hypothetical protein